MDFKNCSVVVFVLLNVLMAESAVYVADSNTSRMIELSGNNQPCKLHSDRFVLKINQLGIDGFQPARNKFILFDFKGDHRQHAAKN